MLTEAQRDKRLAALDKKMTVTQQKIDKAHAAIERGERTLTETAEQRTWLASAPVRSEGDDDELTNAGQAYDDDGPNVPAPVVG